jgi:hypothetical protein
MNPANFGKFVAEEIDKWAKVIKFANIRLMQVGIPSWVLYESRNGQSLVDNCEITERVSGQ